MGKICVFVQINGTFWQHLFPRYINGLREIYTVRIETAAFEMSIVHTSMPSSISPIDSECRLSTPSKRRIFSRVTTPSFHSVATLSKATHAFFCMFRTVLGWLARPSLLKPAISSFLQPPSTRIVLIRNVKWEFGIHGLIMLAKINASLLNEFFIFLFLGKDEETRQCNFGAFCWMSLINWSFRKSASFSKSPLRCYVKCSWYLWSKPWVLDLFPFQSLQALYREVVKTLWRQLQRSCIFFKPRFFTRSSSAPVHSCSTTRPPEYAIHIWKRKIDTNHWSYVNKPAIKKR